MKRKPTELQVRVLRAVQDGVCPLFKSAGVHQSAQVASRALTLCKQAGWVERVWRSCQLRLTAAGRKALKEAQS